MNKAMELFLDFVLIAFITVVVVDIIQQRRPRTFRTKHFIDKQ